MFCEAEEVMTTQYLRESEEVMTTLIFLFTSIYGNQKKSLQAAGIRRGVMTTLTFLFTSIYNSAAGISRSNDYSNL